MEKLPYTSLNSFLRETFGEKTVKLSIDAGFSCPNRDGTLSTKGCIFCSEGGSGDFAGDRRTSIKEQINQQKKLLSKKWTDCKYIAYFQAFTNTYAPVDELERKYMEAIECQDVVAISIGTRPDCINEEVLNLLEKIRKKIFVFVELGLQTSNEETALLINRCYKNEVYEKAVKDLKKININVVTHIIVGLPYETEEDILNSVKFAVENKTDGIKLQLLHVLKNTPLEKLYEETHFPILTKDEYANIIVKCISIIPSDVVIHRFTGDGNKKNLIAPLWSGNKKYVLNTINKKISESFK